MTRGGIIVRFIDVVLILLFGFISISEISRRSIIELPQSSQMPPSNPDEKATLIIGITTEGKYLVDNESTLLENIDDVKAYILQNQLVHFSNNITTSVRIRSNWDTPIKYAIALAQICDELNIIKGIDVVRKSQ